MLLCIPPLRKPRPRRAAGKPEISAHVGDCAWTIGDAPSWLLVKWRDFTTIRMANTLHAEVRLHPYAHDHSVTGVRLLFGVCPASREHRSVQHDGPAKHFQGQLTDEAPDKVNHDRPAIDRSGRRQYIC
jgi:hypothetical protein